MLCWLVKFKVKIFMYPNLIALYEWPLILSLGKTEEVSVIKG